MADLFGDLAELERLSLVSKVTSEIQNHTGMVDKTLAEFAIAQHKNCPDLEGFKTMLGEFFPPTLIESIDRLVLTMDPSRKAANKNKSNGAQASGHDDGRSRVFKGLAIPDKEHNGNGKVDELDDTMAMLEGLAGKKSGAPVNSDSHKRQDYGGREDRSSRKRSRSPEHDKRRSRHKHDEYYEAPIPTPMGQDGYRDRRYNDRRDDRGGQRGDRGNWRDDRYNDQRNGGSRDYGDRNGGQNEGQYGRCLLYTSPSPRD